MSDPLKPNYDETLAFLDWFRPGGPWILTAIAGPSEIETVTFTELGEVRRWLESVGHSHNLYFHVNPALRPLTSKASKADIAAVEWLHVDIDPRAREDVDRERTRIRAKLQEEHNLPEGVPPPTCVIDSGGGFWGLWRLDEPIEIGGDVPTAEDAERYNRQLELLFGADSCHNVDRIARLPGTINRPNKRKRKAGRKAALASVFERTDRVYPITDFVKAPDAQSKDQTFKVEGVKISGNLARYESSDDIPVEGVLPDLLKILLVQGYDPNDSGLVAQIREFYPDVSEKWPSRSEALFWACCELVRQGADDDTIYSVITDSNFGIAAAVLQESTGEPRRTWERYAERQIERAREFAIDPMLAEMNDEYAVVESVGGGKCRVLRKAPDVLDDGNARSRIEYQTFEDFRNANCNRYVSVVNAKGDQDFKPAGHWWLAHRNRRQYKGVVFAPGKDVPGYYNLWQGFSFDARPGSCELYLAHLRDVICSGDEEHFEYLLSWMALTVQRPMMAGQIAVVLRGGQGTGKGTFATHFGALFGRHYLPVRDSNHLFGRFNAHLEDCVVLFADEAFWAGNKKDEGMLKSLITEGEILVEGKFANAGLARNFIHLIIASNEGWIVPAGADDRRFFVLDVSEEHKQDLAYFREIERQMKDGGYEALLHLLMTRDLSVFEVRKVPKTLALQEQKIHSYDPEKKWWFDKLVNGRVFDEDDEWPKYVFKTHLHYDYLAHLRHWERPGRASQTRLGQFIMSAFPEGHDLNGQLRGEVAVVQVDGERRTTKRPRIYRLPPLEVCREHWDRHFGGPFHWPKVREVDEPSDDEPF